MINNVFLNGQSCRLPGVATDAYTDDDSVLYSMTLHVDGKSAIISVFAVPFVWPWNETHPVGTRSGPDDQLGVKWGLLAGPVGIGLWGSPKFGKVLVIGFDRTI